MVNPLLLKSYTKTLEEEKAKVNSKLQNIVMDNCYVQAICNAIAKINKVTQQDMHIQDLFKMPIEEPSFLNHFVPFLGKEEKEAMLKVINTYEEEADAITERYENAQILLDMADRFEDKQRIIQDICKNLFKQ